MKPKSSILTSSASTLPPVASNSTSTTASTTSTTSDDNESERSIGRYVWYRGYVKQVSWCFKKAWRMSSKQRQRKIAAAQVFLRPVWNQKVCKNNYGWTWFNESHFMNIISFVAKKSSMQKKEKKLSRKKSNMLVFVYYCSPIFRCAFLVSE